MAIKRKNGYPVNPFDFITKVYADDLTGALSTTKANKIQESGTQDIANLGIGDTVAAGNWDINTNIDPTLTGTLTFKGNEEFTNILTFGPALVKLEENQEDEMLFEDPDWTTNVVNFNYLLEGTVTIVGKTGSINPGIFTKSGTTVFKDLSDVKSELEASIATKVNVTDIVNDVVTGGTAVPLSAEQGKLLDAKISTAAQSGQDRGTVRNALTSQGNSWGVDEVGDPQEPGTGSGYLVGDALFTPSGADEINAILTVTSIGSGGGVLSASVNKKGDYKTNQTGDVNMLGGHGSGAVLDLTFIQELNSKLSDIPTPQPNDRVLVLQDELHNGTSWWWTMADYDGDTTYHWIPLAPGDAAARDFTVSPILSSELSTNAVTTVKITDLNVTLGKLAQSVQDSLTAADHAVPANDDIEGGTYTKLTVDTKGLVTSGADATGADIALTGYTKAAAATAISASDTTNVALGKLEFKLDKAINDLLNCAKLDAENVFNAYQWFSEGAGFGNGEEPEEPEEDE